MVTMFKILSEKISFFFGIVLQFIRHRDAITSFSLFDCSFCQNMYRINLILKESILFICLRLMERSVQEQIKLESKERRSNIYRIGSFVEGNDSGLVSDNIPTLWEVITENDEGPLSQSMCSGRESICHFSSIRMFSIFTPTLSMHMHAQLKGGQGLNYNVKMLQFILQLKKVK